MHVTAIIAAGGSGRRVGGPVPKQLLEIGGRPILRHAVEAFVSHPSVSEVIVALPPALATAPPEWLGPVRVVAGGERRQDSVANALDAVQPATEIVLVHDAARPFVTADIITRAIDAAAMHGAAIAAVPVSDTVKHVSTDPPGLVRGTLPREEIYLAQTPQAFRAEVLRAAVALGRSGVDATDESALAERAGYAVHVVEGGLTNVKITSAADLERARGAPAQGGSRRVGTGYDLHRLVEGRPLILGGVSIPSTRGAIGHSDADVVCHSVIDALLGATRLGDIGQLFPDTDAAWKDASSLGLLRRAVALLTEAGWQVANVDVVVILEQPKVGPHRRAIEHHISEALGVDASRVSVKAKTNEGVDAVGRGEAIAAHAVALVERR